MTGASKNCLKTNNYTEPEKLAFKDVKKNNLICVSRDLTVYLSRGRYWSQYSVFVAKNRIVIQTVKEKKEKKKRKELHSSSIMHCFKSEICFSMNLFSSKFRLVF